MVCIGALTRTRPEARSHSALRFITPDSAQFTLYERCEAAANLVCAGLDANLKLMTAVDCIKIRNNVGGIMMTAFAINLKLKKKVRRKRISFSYFINYCETRAIETIFALLRQLSRYGPTHRKSVSPILRHPNDPWIGRG